MYDWQQQQLYTHDNNPAHNSLLEDGRFTKFVTNFYVDSKRRDWTVYWDMNPKYVVQYCFWYDEKEKRYTSDTAGITTNIKRYYELNYFTEFGDSIVMVYGNDCLLVNEGNSFVSLLDSSSASFNIEYAYVTDVLQDNEKLLWVATDNGLYNTLANNSLSNHLVLDEQKAPASITCVMQYADTDIWIGTWERGVLPLGKSIYDYILSNMALKKADTDHNTAKEYMSRISNNSSRMMEAMDDIVWSINPVNDNLRKVAARMKEFAGNSLEVRDMNYTFHIDEEAKDLGFDMETRRGIFLIFKEAINNILKYAKCTEVNISMQLQKKCMVMTIADNGVGFDPNKQVAAHRGNGLKNMSKRAEDMHGGRLSVETALGKGTTLVLKIPL